MDRDLIYEAAFIPELWPEVLDLLCAMTDSWGAALLCVDNGGAYRFTCNAPYRPLLESFVKSPKTYRNLRMERGIAKRHHGFMADLDVMTSEEIDRDPIYNDFLRPAGIGWTAGTAMPIPTGDVLIFDFNRLAARGPFERSTIDRLQEVRPGLARSALTAARLGLERARMATETLSALGLPGAVITRRGRVLAANAEFEALTDHVALGAHDAIRLTDRSAQALLATALAKLSDDGVPAVHSIPAAATEVGPPVVFHLLPVRRRAHDLFGSADAILMFTPIDTPDTPSGEMLNALFDLTAAEARLAGSILAGGTIKEVASQFGLSEETLRGRMKSIFAKTGVSRQAELVRLLSGLTPRLALHGRPSGSSGREG